MDIKVEGGQVLSGEVYPSGLKNSAVALIPASLLFKEKITFENIPDITDVQRLLNILQKMGSLVSWSKEKRVLEIDNSNISFSELGEEDLGNMKGTSLLWGPMLSRFGKVMFDELPGGCTLGFRTLDPHYTAFRDLGVKVEESARQVGMDATNAHSGEIWLTEMSPTATENALMLAVGLSGTTKIVGAASEPQVQDLCNFLVDCGAKISGIGSSVLEIEGGHELKAKSFRVTSDHYEIATFLALGALTGGRVMVHDVLRGLFRPVESVFSRFGIEVKYDGGGALIEGNQKIEITTEEGRGILVIRAQPWPALPVDILPIFIPISLAAPRGQVIFHNWMYDAGLFWTSEFQKLGANIIMADPHRVLVTAGNKLEGAKLEAPYIIRAVVAMVMTAMISKGESLILNADALYRGHPNFAQNLKNLGARIEEITGE